MGPEGSGCCAYFVMIVRARVIVCSIAVCPCTSEDPEPQGLPHDVSPAIIRFFGNEDDGSSRTAMAQTEHAAVSVLRRGAGLRTDAGVHTLGELAPLPIEHTLAHRQ